MAERRYKVSTLPRKVARRTETAEQVMIKNAIVRPKKFLKWCLLGALLLIVAIKGAMNQVELFTKMGMFLKGPQSLSVQELVYGFNEKMKNEGFLIGAVQWVSKPLQYKAGTFAVSLPDGGSAEGVVLLMGFSEEKSPIYQVQMRFTEEQSVYLAHAAEGVFAAVNPAPTAEQAKRFAEVLELCEAPFENYLPEYWLKDTGLGDIAIFLREDTVSMRWWFRDFGQGEG